MKAAYAEILPGIHSRHADGMQGLAGHGIRAVIHPVAEHALVKGRLRIDGRGGQLYLKTGLILLPKGVVPYEMVRGKRLAPVGRLVQRIAEPSRERNGMLLEIDA